MARHLTGERGQHLTHMTGFPLDAVTQDVGLNARGQCDSRGGLQ